MPQDNQPSSHFNIKLIHAALQLVQHQGVAIDTALAGSVIDKNHLDIPGQRYPTAAFESLLLHLVQVTKNHKLATLCAEATQPRMLGALGFLMTTANTLLDAYQMLSDYFPLIYEGVSLEVIHEQENCILNLHLTNDNRYVSEFFISCLLNWPRWLSGRAVHAQSVSYRFKSSQPLNYQQQLSLSVNFEQPCDQVIIRNQYMNLKCAEANFEMHQQHRSYADTLLIKYSQKQALIAQTKYQIRALLETALLTNDPNSPNSVRREQVAANLNMSLRTFQRKLNAQDSNFQKIYDSVRHEICLQLMGNLDNNFGQIADKLGFSNLSAFQKAFKRWMKIPPSVYRKQIAATLSETPKSFVNPKPAAIWHQVMDEQALNHTIALKLDALSAFTKQLLTIAGLAQQTTNKALSLTELADISRNSVARLSIYLWPAQEQQLIESIDAIDPNTALIEFNPQRVSSVILQELSPLALARLHYQLATFNQTNAHHEQALAHLFAIDLTHLKLIQLQAIIDYCEQRRDTNSPSQLQLNALYNLQITCATYAGVDKAIIDQLAIERLAIWVDLGYLTKAQQSVHDLNEALLTADQRVTLAITNAQLLVALGNTDQALRLLTNTADHECMLSLDIQDDSKVLLAIAKQLEYLQQPCLLNFSDQQSLNSVSTALYNNQQRILQKIVVICLQQNLSRKAAGVIAKMIGISHHYNDTFYSSFAYAHFSWVCSWVAADLTLAQRCRDYALTLAQSHSPTHLKSCQLILLTRENHWLEPVPKSIWAIKQGLIDQSLAGNEIVERQRLLLQLLLCTGEVLSNIRQQCEQTLQTIPEKRDERHCQIFYHIIEAIDSINQKTYQNQNINYTNVDRAFCQLFSALYRFDYNLWPQIADWDARIEGEIASHYMTTEAVFMCTLMRIYLADVHQIDARSKAKIESDINRLHIWQAQQKENFTVQYYLVSAVYSTKFSTPDEAFKHFEKCYEHITQFGFLHHKILFFHFYEQLLTRDHLTLSHLCQEKKAQNLSLWLV